MYIYINAHDLNYASKFDTIEKAEEYLRLRSTEGGYSWSAGIAEIIKVAANEKAEVRYAELPAEEFFAAAKAKKDAYKALGVDFNNID